MHPAHGTRTATVRQSGNFPLPPQIPHNRVSRAARRSQRILNVVVPGQRGDLVEFRAACPRGVWLAWVLQVPDVDLEGRCEMTEAHKSCKTREDMN